MAETPDLPGAPGPIEPDAHRPIEPDVPAPVEPEPPGPTRPDGPARSQPRHYVALLVIAAATALGLGVALKAPSQFGANDISRWCTVWSLLERGSYKIDDCPWQSKTQDKVLRPDPFAQPDLDADPDAEPERFFYSSKPPFLPTLIAGMLYPFRAATGVELDKVIPQARLPRYVEKEVDGEIVRTLEEPEKPAEWPVYVFYFKPIVLLFNIVPLLFSLILFARYLDRHASNDWAWFFGLFAAAWGVLLLPFDQTLNNHTIAAYSAFFALYALLRAWTSEEPPRWSLAVAGFFGAFCACNELPAALFGILLFVAVLVRFPRQTLIWFVPAAAIPCVFFLVTQYLAFGQVRPVYEEFGTRSYEYQGSYWTTPLELDYFNKHPESAAKYLFHMTFGHHGVFSLTPIFLFSVYGAYRLIRDRSRRDLAILGWLTLFLTVALIAFYTWNPKARNYGGSTQGLRWLFWLIPFWLLTLPFGVEAGERRLWVRRLSLVALAVSALTVGYALRSPWSHPWLLDMMEHLNLYTLPR